MADLNALIEQRIQELSNPKPIVEKKVKPVVKPQSFDFGKYTNQEEENTGHIKEGAKALGRAAIAIPEFASNAMQAGAGVLGKLGGVPLEQNKVRNYLKQGTDEMEAMKKEIAPSQQYAEEHPVISGVENAVEGLAPLVYAPLLGNAMPAAFGASTFNKAIEKQKLEHPERSENERMLRAAPGALAETALFAAMPGITSKIASKAGLESAGKILSDTDVLGLGEKAGGSVLKTALQRGAIDTPYLMAQGKVVGGLEALSGVQTPEEYSEGFSKENLLKEALTNFGMGAGFGALHARQWKKQAEELNTLATHPDPTVRSTGINNIADLLTQKGYPEEAKTFKANIDDYEKLKDYSEAYGTSLSEATTAKLGLDKYIKDNIELIDKPRLTNDTSSVSILEDNTPIKQFINKGLGYDSETRTGLSSEVGRGQESVSIKPLERTSEEAISPSGNVQAYERQGESPRVTTGQIESILRDPVTIKDSYENEKPIATKESLSPLALQNLERLKKIGEVLEHEGNYYPTRKLVERQDREVLREQQKQEKINRVNQGLEKSGAKVRAGEPKVEQQKVVKPVSEIVPEKVKTVKPVKEPETKETTVEKPIKETKIGDLDYEKDPVFIALSKADKKLIREQDRAIRNQVWEGIKPKLEGKIVEPKKVTPKEKNKIREEAPKKTVEQTQAGKDLRAKANTMSFEDYNKEMQKLYGARHSEKVTLSTWNHANGITNGKREAKPTSTTREEKPTNVIATSKNSKDLVTKIKSRLSKGFNTTRDKYHYILELERNLGNSLDPENRKTYNELFKIVPELENLFKNVKEIKREGKQQSRELKATKREEAIIGEKAEAPENYIETLEKQAKQIKELEQLKKEKLAKAIKEKQTITKEKLKEPTKTETVEKPVYDRAEEIKLEGAIRAAQRRLDTLENKGASADSIRKADFDLSQLEENLDNLRSTINKSQTPSKEDLKEKQLFKESNTTAAKDYEELLKSSKSVSASASIPDNIKGFVEQIQKDFSIKGKVFVTTTSDIKQSDLNKISSFKEIHEENGSYVGIIVSLKDGNKIIALNDERIKTTNTLVRTLSHELGHAIINDHLRNAPEEVQKAIQKDTISWFARMQKGDSKALDELYQESDKTWSDFKREYASYLNKEGNPLAIAGTKRANLFNEYLAEQVAKYIKVNHVKPEGVITRFFSELATRLKAVYAKYVDNAIQNRYPVDSITKWLDGLVEQGKIKEVKGNSIEQIQLSNITDQVKDLYKKSEALIPNSVKKEYSILEKATTKETSEIASWFKKTFAPYIGASNLEKDYAMNIKAIPKRIADQLNVVMEQYKEPSTGKTYNFHEYFAKKSAKEQIDFMDKARHMNEKDVADGLYSKYNFTKEEEAFLKLSKEYTDKIYDELKEYIPNLPKRENHFGLALMWDKIPGREEETSFKDLPFGRKLLGTEGFKKKRSERSIHEMLAEGGELKSVNPLETVLNYVHEAHKFLGISKTLEDMQVEGMAKYITNTEKSLIPKNWKALDTKGLELFAKVLQPRGFNIKLEDNSYITDKSGKPAFYSSNKELEKALKTKGLTKEQVTIERENKQLFGFAGYQLKDAEGETVLSSNSKETLVKYWEKHLDALGEDAKISTKFIPEQTARMGTIYFPEHFADMLNNYLSRDKFRGNPIGGNLTKAKNVYTKLELGLSAFHFNVINFEAAASATSLGIRRALMEKRISAFSDTMAGVRGEDGLLNDMKEYLRNPEAFNPESPLFKKETDIRIKKALGKDVDFRDLVEQFYHAGGLVGQDKSLRGIENSRYANMHLSLVPSNFKKTVNQFTDRLKADGLDVSDGKSKLKVYGKTIPAVLEVTSNYLFEHYIPQIKFAFFAKEYAFEMQKQRVAIEGGLTDKNSIARETMSFIEDRFGEMNWENLWLDKTWKSSIQFLMRSATWKLGTAKALWKGGKNLGQFFTMQKDAQGQRVQINTQGAWLISIVAINALAATLVNTLATGELPNSIKDIAFPRYSERDPEARLALPTYLKEFIAIGEAVKKDPYHIPTSWVKGGINGFLSKVYDTYLNKDYFNTQIRNPDDMFLKQAIDVGLYVMPIPFSVGTAMREVESGEPKSMSIVKGIAGINKAPSYINQTRAEQEAFKLAQEASGVRVKSPEQFKHMRDVSRIASDVKLGDTSSFEEAISAGELSKRDIKTIKDKALLHPLTRIVSRLQWKDAIKVYKKASPEERDIINKMMKEKYARAISSASPEDKEDIVKQGIEIFS